MSEALTITGLKETRQALEALGQTTEKKIIRKGLRAGGKVVKSAEESEAPDRSGLTRSNIKVRAGKSGKGKISINVGLSAKDFPPERWYDAFVVFGHKVGSRNLGDSRTSVPANNFLERALASSGQNAVDTVTQKWAELIEEAAAKKGQG